MVTLQEIYRPIQSQLAATEALLVRELALRDGLLGEMTRYVARMPGKRIRPALALFAAQITGTYQKGTHSGRRVSPSSTSPAVPLAAVVEMIHTATLLHDDVIDGASLRRGLSTLNAKWGDTLSVLSGDYLYSKAFCILGGMGHQGVLTLLSETAREVCEGEVAQIHHQRDLALSRREYLKIIRRKTASLMGASAQAGALLAGASESKAKRLRVFGLNFGLAFQIMDDAQDLLGEEEALGKSLGTDVALGQLTLPLLYLKDVAGEKTRRHLAFCFNGNGTHSPAQMEERLAALKEEASRLRVGAYCRKVASSYLAQARKALSSFPDSPHKRSLFLLTEYLVG